MGKEFNISKTSGHCRACQKQLAEAEQFVATVREVGEEFHREDYCEACWAARGDENSADLFGVWRGRVPRAQEKKKLLVDDDLIINFFERLDGAEAPARISYRFVLALVLMRKKLLVYDSTKQMPDGRSAWRMHFKGTDQKHEVIDPDMDEEKIAEVSRSLSDIMEGGI